MAWPPKTAEYEAALHAAGKVFISQLPANTNLGPSVAGKPGGRTAWRPDARPAYELAPFAVQAEMAARDLGQRIEATPGTVAIALDEAITPIIEATGLDHGALGVVAKGLGIPLSLLVLALLFVGYALLRNVGMVPPLSKVVRQ